MSSRKGSDPEIRRRIIEGLERVGGSVRAATPDAIKDKLGLLDVTVTQFNKALGSLCYNHRRVAWSRTSEGVDGGISGTYSRSHVVTTK